MLLVAKVFLCVCVLEETWKKSVHSVIVYDL